MNAKQRLVPHPRANSKSDQTAIERALKLGTLRLDTWFWELFAVSFSVLCLTAILCILLVYDGKASPSLPRELTLNTIVSVLATASKSSLAFAAGTAIGQLKWTWFHKEKKPLHHLQSIDDAAMDHWGLSWSYSSIKDALWYVWARW